MKKLVFCLLFLSGVNSVFGMEVDGLLGRELTKRPLSVEELLADVQQCIFDGEYGKIEGLLLKAKNVSNTPEQKNLILSNLISLYTYQQDIERMRQTVEELRKGNENTESPSSRFSLASGLINIGTYHCKLGQIKQARPYFEEAVQISVDFNEVQKQAQHYLAMCDKQSTKN